MIVKIPESAVATLRQQQARVAAEQQEFSKLAGLVAGTLQIPVGSKFDQEKMEFEVEEKAEEKAAA